MLLDIGNFVQQLLATLAQGLESQNRFFLRILYLAHRPHQTKLIPIGCRKSRSLPASLRVS